MKLKASLGYAVGDLGINLYFISTLTYLLYFYTDVLGISAAAAAGVFFLKMNKASISMTSTELNK